jgi:hypothetical protein
MEMEVGENEDSYDFDNGWRESYKALDEGREEENVCWQKKSCQCRKWMNDAEA